MNNHESAMLPQYSDLQRYAGPPKHLHEVLRCTMLDGPLSVRSLGVKSGSTNYKGRRISGYETAYNIAQGCPSAAVVHGDTAEKPK